jgi:hypothetical protein
MVAITLINTAQAYKRDAHVRSPAKIYAKAVDGSSEPEKTYTTAKSATSDSELPCDPSGEVGFLFGCSLTIQKITDFAFADVQSMILV